MVRINRVLAFDPAAHFGWSLVENEKYIDGGTETFSFPTKAKKNKGIPRGRKWYEAATWINYKIRLMKPDYVVCEDVKHHSSVLSAHSFGFLKYTIEAACYATETPFYPIGVTVWKEISAKDGGADKSEVAKNVSKIYPGVVWVTDDHSDSAGMAYAFQQMLENNRLDELTNASGGKKKKSKKS